MRLKPFDFRNIKALFSAKSSKENAGQESFGVFKTSFRILKFFSPFMKKEFFQMTFWIYVKNLYFFPFPLNFDHKNAIKGATPCKFFLQIKILKINLRKIAKKSIEFPGKN